MKPRRKTDQTCNPCQIQGLTWIFDRYPVVALNPDCRGSYTGALIVHSMKSHRRYRTQDEIRAEVFDCIERFHNPRMRRRVAMQDQQFSALFKPSVVAG